MELQEGSHFLVVSVGLFALLEVLINFERHLQEEEKIQPVRGSLWLTREEWRRSCIPILRGTLLGFAKRLLPGATTIATVIILRPRARAEQNARAVRPGDVEAVSPQIGDIHQVSNVFEDEVSISIHVYGANIGAVQRATWQPDGRRWR